AEFECACEEFAPKRNGGVTDGTEPDQPTGIANPGAAPSEAQAGGDIPPPAPRTGYSGTKGNVPISQSTNSKIVLRTSSGAYTVLLSGNKDECANQVGALGVDD